MKKIVVLVVGMLLFSLVFGGGIPSFLSSTGSDEQMGYLDNGEVVARFEGTDHGGATITVFYDGVEYRRHEGGSEFMPSELFIAFSDVKKLNSWGPNFLIRSSDGSSIEFQVVNARDGSKLKQKMRELVREAGGSV